MSNCRVSLFPVFRMVIEIGRPHAWEAYQSGETCLHPNAPEKCALVDKFRKKRIIFESF